MTNKLMFDFENGNGPVPAHQHPNGGGWIAGTAHVDSTCYVGPGARVFGKARMFDNACMSGNARMYDDAEMSGNARIFGTAIIEKTPPSVNRSDGYIFILAPCKDGELRILAGCRYFTFQEAYEHWNKTRAGTPLGAETIAILKYFESVIEIFYNGN